MAGGPERERAEDASVQKCELPRRPAEAAEGWEPPRLIAIDDGQGEPVPADQLAEQRLHLHLERLRFLHHRPDAVGDSLLDQRVQRTHRGGESHRQLHLRLLEGRKTARAEVLQVAALCASFVPFRAIRRGWRSDKSQRRLLPAPVAQQSERPRAQPVQNLPENPRPAHGGRAKRRSAVHVGDFRRADQLEGPARGDPQQEHAEQGREPGEAGQGGGEASGGSASAVANAPARR